MKTAVIIPARGNSKRLSEKNILKFNNIPLVAHSILYAKANPQVADDIYVTTDNDKIKAIARQYGAKVIDRPKSISDDYATTVSALKHTLESLETKYDAVILLQPTYPLRPKHLLENAYKKFVESHCDSLMTVSVNTKKLGKISNGRFHPYTYKMGQRSQDIEPLYFENGLLYISKTELILDNKILGDLNLPLIVDHPFASVDIDTIDDFKYAEFVLKQYSND